MATALRCGSGRTALLTAILSGCAASPVPTDTNNAYLAAATCAAAAGYTPQAQGSVFGPDTTVTEAMDILSNDFSVPPSAIPPIRTCTEARIGSS